MENALKDNVNVSLNLKEKTVLLRYVRIDVIITEYVSMVNALAIMASVAHHVK